MKKDNGKIVVIIVSIIIFLIFLIYNVYEFKNNNNKIQSHKPPKAQENVNLEDLIDDKLIVNGEEKDIKVYEFVSHLGFNIRYQTSLFSLSRLSNGSIKIYLNNNENNYILIEKLQENAYYKAYNELNNKEYVKDNYFISYKFLKGSVLTFLKITKSIDINTQEYDLINANLDYILSSLTLTS